MSVDRSVSQSWNVKGHYFPKFPPSRNTSMCKSARVQVHLDQRQQCGEDEDQDDFNWLLSPYLTSLQLSPFHFLYCSFSLSPSFPQWRPLSVAEERSPPRSWEGRIQIGHAPRLHTSFHRSDWSDWWCPPRGSPIRLRSQDRNHRELYSMAAPLL